MIKIVMGTIMVIVLFSRALMIPVYMSQLKLMPEIAPATAKMLSNTSFAIMIFALALGAFIVLKAMWEGRQAERVQVAQVRSRRATARQREERAGCSRWSRCTAHEDPASG